MSETPRIAMTPAELPAQRIYEVVDLPEIPTGFAPVLTLGGGADAPFPKRRPSSMRYLGSAEWAWGPINSRIDAYHLHRGRMHWCLYVQDLDPNDPEFAWMPAAYVERHGVDERTAAVHLMLAVWRLSASDFDLDPFHWINQAGFLTVPDCMAIARAVWGAEQEPDDRLV
jgi:hypothetical protein